MCSASCLIHRLLSTSQLKAHQGSLHMLDIDYFYLPLFTSRYSMSTTSLVEARGRLLGPIVQLVGSSHHPGLPCS